MTDDNIPDWLTPGSQVCILAPGKWESDGSGRITTTTVSKIGKRDIVLDNGERFRLTGLHNGHVYRSSGTWEMGSQSLYPADAPEVGKMRAANRVRNIWRSVDDQADALAKAARNRDEQAAQEALSAIRESLARLNPTIPSTDSIDYANFISELAKQAPSHKEALGELASAILEIDQGNTWPATAKFISGVLNGVTEPEPDAAKRFDDGGT
jgi:hypothetical protein